MSDKPRDLEARIVRALDDEAAQLDAVTRRRLREARAYALAVAKLPHHRVGWWMVPAGATAMVLLAVLLWWQQPAPSPALVPADFEMLTHQEPLELYQDLDFYLWLAREAEHAG